MMAIDRVLLMGVTDLRAFLLLTVGFSAVFIMPFAHGYTYEQDVYAINTLFVALETPPLAGWSATGGDPCMEQWQGVLCVNSNITSIKLDEANLGGQLGQNLANFTSLITLDLSNNHIGGTIPDNLPIKIRQFFLSGNLFTGSIPGSLSLLILLSDMSLNNNLLTGELPDSFQSLTGLINLDLSFNNLSGQLPPSMEGLSSLTMLYLQNNRLSGTLNVLQDLHLQDLNIENNLFSGPIPGNLFNTPNFKKDGNPFNTSIAPSPMLPPSPLPLIPQLNAPASSYGPIPGYDIPGKNNKISVLKVVGFAAIGVCILLIVLLTIMFCTSRMQEKKLKHQTTGTRQHVMIDDRSQGNYSWDELNKSNAVIEEVSKGSTQNTKEHKINMPESKAGQMPLNVEEVLLKPIGTINKNSNSPGINNSSTYATSFSVATLQQCTNSFSEENLIKDSIIGQVYMGELPERKLLTIMKVNNMNLSPNDNFMNLITSISKIQHPNILELVGYCKEFGQQLLVYSYFSKITLHDALHSEDGLKEKLSWNARIKVALGSAKALEYLHDHCQPPIIHQRFEPSIILIDDSLDVQVSECGLFSLSSSSCIQLSDCISSYHAPEVSDSGFYCEQSDVYSFGVVMLELLTGRRPYDASLPREEQHIVRWASSQLHDIDLLTRMVDPAIHGRYPVKSLSRFADIINRCIQPVPEFRPSMSEVVQDLAHVIKDGTRT